MSNPIDPSDPTNWDIPLWVVLIGRTHANLNHVKILNVTGEPVVWGHSVWKGSPGYRTIGQTMGIFTQGYVAWKFFTDGQSRADCLDKVF